MNDQLLTACKNALKAFEGGAENVKEYEPDAEAWQAIIAELKAVIAPASLLQAAESALYLLDDHALDEDYVGQVKTTVGQLKAAIALTKTRS